MTGKTATIEISELRKRLRAAIEQSRRAAADRRAKQEAASAAYERFLEDTAVPVAHMLSNALRAEGYQFTVFTPNNGLRLASAKSADDFIEFHLDMQAEPVVLLRVNRSRGRRVTQHERPLARKTPDELNEEDVVRALLEEIAPFVER